MPFRECIDTALEQGEINERWANTARAIYDDHLAAFEPNMPRGEAMAEAARSAFRFLEDQASERRRQEFLSLSAQRDIMGRLDSYRSYLTGEADPFKGATGLFDRLLPGRNGFAVEQQRNYWRNQAHALMDTAFATFRPDWLLRRRNAPIMQNVVRELFGEQTGDDVARSIATGWTNAAEFLRSNFNRFGGHIGALEKWGLPQGHDRRALREAGFEQWRQAITPLLDLDRMVDRDTGRPFGEANPSLRDSSIANALRGVYDTIITDGWANREATSAGGRARANTRADHRFLIFKNADGWMAYQRRFGEPDPFNSMMGHIDALSRDIALMQVLGPNPASTVRWLGQELSRRRAIANAPEDRVTNAMHLIETMHDMTTGRAFAPLNSTVASIGADFGNVLVSTQLGAAVLAAVPGDINTQIMARRLNGMPTTRLFSTMLRQLNPANAEHRMAAVRIGAGAQRYADRLADQARYVGELHGHRWSKLLADRVLTWSGLTPWTEAGRASFFADALGTIADRSGSTWAQLPETFRGALQRYRIGEAEWDAIRSTPHYLVNDLAYIRPEDIANNRTLDPSVAMELAQRVADWAGTETEFAVPSGSLAGQAMARGKNPPGNVSGLLQDSILKYKSFGLTMLMSHGRRGTSFGWRRGGAYFGALVVTSMFAGAITIQMKEIAAGRDPRDMTDWRFWSAALAQGGGMTIIGDFAYAGLQGAARTGGSFGEALAGPGIGKIGEVFRALFGGVMNPAENDVVADTATGLLNLTKRTMPGGNIWYLRAALERYVFDAIQEDIDPRWRRRLNSIESWYRRNYGNGFWWKRGEQPGFDGSEIRTPDLSAALGSEQ